MDEREIKDAYSRLNLAREHLYFAGEEVIRSKYALDTKKAHGYNTGEISGKNDVERKASEIAYLSADFDQLHNLEDQERFYRHEFEIAQALVEMVRALLRLAELTARAEV